MFPERFSALEMFGSWALPTERERHDRKSASSLTEIRAFYDAMLPVLPAALDYLNGFDLNELPTAERRLLDLCLAMVEAAMAIEMFGDADPPYLMSLDRFEPVHDRWAR